MRVSFAYGLIFFSVLAMDLRAEEPTNTFAVLIAGRKDSESQVSFANDVRLAHQTLLERGVPAKQIRLLGSDVSSTPFSVKELKMALSDFAKSAAPGSQFLVYLAAHGDISGEFGATPWLTGGINAKDMSNALKENVPADAQKVLIVDSCLAGKMKTVFDRSDWVIMTSSDSDGFGYGAEKDGDHSKAHYGIFSYTFFGALRGKYPDQTPVNADANGDSRVSFREAFDWAVLRGSEAMKSEETPAWANWIPGIRNEYDPFWLCSQGSENSGLCHAQKSPVCSVIPAGFDSLRDLKVKLAQDATRIQGKPFLRPQEKIPGDLNADRKVDNIDAFLLMERLEKKGDLPLNEMDRIGDINSDGKLDGADLTLLREKISSR